MTPAKPNWKGIARPSATWKRCATGGTRRNRQTEADHLPLFAFTHGDLRYSGAISAITSEKNALYATETGYLSCRGTGAYKEFDVGLVFRSIGYKGLPIPGVPFYDRWGIIPNEKGCVTAEHGARLCPVSTPSAGPSGARAA